MPVKKTSTKKVGSKKMDMPHPPMYPFHQSHWCHSTHFGKKLIMTFFGILIVYLVIFVGVLTRNELKKFNYIGLEDKTERTIFVEGQAEVDVAPDVATISMGVYSEKETVVEAQAENTSLMNEIMVRLKELGISEEDIQTSQYNVSPTYDWTAEDGSELSGYSVSQRINVKMKDVSLADKVVALAGSVGINDVGQLTYSVDERDVYLDEAREKALEKVAQKARTLSQALGVRMVGIVSYDEYELGENNAIKYPMEQNMVGYGDETPVPDLQTGTQTVGLHVSVTFEIR